MKKCKMHNIISYVVNIIFVGFIIFSNKNLLSNNNKIILKNMDENTQVNELNTTIDELNLSYTEYANYMQTSKSNLATAITNAGIVTDSNADFETMIANVSNIITNKTGDATATETQILTGQTAYVNGEKVTGTMPNNDAWTDTPSENGKVTIPEGYHNGSGYVDTTSVYNAGVTDGKSKGSPYTKDNPDSFKLRGSVGASGYRSYGNTINTKVYDVTNASKIIFTTNITQSGSFHEWGGSWYRTYQLDSQAAVTIPTGTKTYTLDVSNVSKITFTFGVAGWSTDASGNVLDLTANVTNLYME